MFTGLIQTTGRLVRLERVGGDARLRIRPEAPLRDPELGESIAINGVCLTLEDAEGGILSVYASGETLSRTTLGGLQPGAALNLERALALGDRVGGHLVSGHVDCVAEVQQLRRSGQSWIVRVGFPEPWGRYAVSKGSVALDGVSLTINDCGKAFLEVNIIPATFRATTLQDWEAGCAVNMETDLIAKYVERLLEPWGQTGGTRGRSPGGVSLDTLSKHGFL